MNYQKLSTVWCVIALLLQPLSAYAGQPEAALVGLWQHEDQPVVVEMKLQNGLLQGAVVSNTAKPESVGKKLFRDLVYNLEPGNWTGTVYVLKLDEEKDVTIMLISPEQFLMTVKVGLFSKKVHWNKVSSATTITQ